MFDASTMFRATGPTISPSLSPSKSPVTPSPTTDQPTSAEPSLSPSKAPVTGCPTPDGSSSSSSQPQVSCRLEHFYRRTVLCFRSLTSFSYSRLLLLNL